MKEKIFVDTNAFIFLLTKGKNWRKIGKIFDENYQLSTNFQVLNEVKYKLLWIEASKELKTTKKFEITKYIKENNRLRKKTLSKFREFYINMKIKFEIYSMSDKEEMASISLSQKYGLLPTDSSIAATIIQNNIKKILTDDKDFKKIKYLEIIEV